MYLKTNKNTFHMLILQLFLSQFGSTYYGYFVMWNMNIYIYSSCIKKNIYKKNNSDKIIINEGAFLVVW